MSAEFAPIVVFAYRRPDHLDRCLASLAQNPEAHGSQLIIFCDGAKTDSERREVLATRDVANSARGFASVGVVESEENRGLAASVISGVSQVLDERESVIVVEDDIVVSVDFLAYMNEGLALYREDPRVVSIHGFLPVVDVELPQSFFLRGADCWGWATWRRAWSEIDFDGETLLARMEMNPDRRLFDFDGAYPYLQMLRDQVDGKIDSWAIRWYAAAFLAGQFTLHPGVSLVTNTGMEGSGTHAGYVEGLSSSASRISLPLMKADVREEPQFRTAVSRALRTRTSKWRKVGQWLRSTRMGR